jgi:hypothetical protein
MGSLLQAFEEEEKIKRRTSLLDAFPDPDKPLSRSEAKALGVKGKTTAKQRQVIGDVVKRRTAADFLAGATSGASGLSTPTATPFTRSFAKGFASQTQIPALVGKEFAPPETTSGKVADALGRATETIIELVGIGKVFRGVGVVGRGLAGRGGQIALQFGAQESTQQLRKFVAETIHDDDFDFEGGKSVLDSMALGFAFSLAATGLGKGAKALWSKLKPTEQARALKVLGLKKGASLDKINQAARELSVKHHPDKVAGMRQQFEKVISARDVLREEVRQNIIQRGAAPAADAVSRGAALPGQTAAPPPPGAIQPTTQVPATTPPATLGAPPVPRTLITPSEAPGVAVARAGVTPTPQVPQADIVDVRAVGPPSGVSTQASEATPAPVEPQPPAKRGTKARKEQEIAKKQRKPVKATQQQIEIGERFGLTEQNVVSRLHKAQLRFEELRSKPAADLKPAQKKELEFLTRKRTDIQALLGRDNKPLSREQVEKRAGQFGIEVSGRTTKDILTDIVARAKEQRTRGQKPDPVTITPAKLLKFSLQHEAKGSRSGFRAGKAHVLEQVGPALHEAKVGRREGFLAGGRSVVEAHKELLAFAEEVLPKDEAKLVVRAARKAVKARTPGEINKVIEAVNRMVENHRKADAIQGVKDAVKKAKKAKLRPDAATELDKVLRDFTLTSPKEKTIARMKSRLSELQKDEHEIGDIPQKLVDRAINILTNAKRDTLQDFTADEVNAIADAITNLIHQDALKKELLGTRKFRKAQEAIKTATTDVSTRWGKKQAVQAGQIDDATQRRRLTRAWQAIKSISTWDQLNVRTKAQILGGRGSVAEEVLANNLQRGESKVTEISIDSVEYMEGVLAKNNVDDAKLKEWSAALGAKLFRSPVKPVKVKLPTARGEDGKRVRTVEMTVAERIEFLRFAADPQNRAQVLADKNKGIVFARDEAKKAISISREDLKAIVDSASKAEKAVAGAMVNYTNGRAPGHINISEQVKETWLRMMGFPLRTHDNYVGRTRSGEHQKFDPTKTAQSLQDLRLERMGIFKERAASTAPFVIGDAFARFHADVNRMGAFIGKAEPAHDAQRLLNDLKFRRSVKEAFKDGSALLSDLEQTVEFYTGLDKPVPGPIDKLFKTLLNRAHVGVLAVKPHIVAYQTVSLLNASATGLKGVYSPAHYRRSEMKRMRGILNKFSPDMNARERGGSFQILTPASAGPTLRGMYGLEGKKLKSIHRADSSVMELIGLAAESEGKAKGLTGNALHEFAARRTEQVVSDTQPTWDTTTLSSLAREGRKGAFKHMLVMFASQRNKNLNMATQAVNDYMFSDKGGAAKKTLAQRALTPIMATAILLYAINKAYWKGLSSFARGLGFKPKDPKKDWRADMSGIIRRMLGNWLIVGDIVSATLQGIFSGLKGEPPGFGRDRGLIVLDATKEAIETTQLIAKFFAETAKDERYSERSKKSGEKKNIDTLSRLIEKGAGPISVFSGLPLQGIVQIAGPFLPHRQGEEEKPTTPKFQSGF